MKIFLLILSVAMLTTTILCQGETGRPAELKGLTKVYIDTVADLDDYKRIEERITKAKVPGLTIVDSRDEAEIVLMFAGTEFQNPEALEVLAGEGRVYIKNKDGEPRLVMRVRNEQQSRMEKRPVTKFVSEFLDVYRKVNGIKK